jgi:predicted cupin superfamily sugar epimerase
MTAKEIIKKLGLKKHPEGGYYRETYCSKGKIVVRGRKRNYSSAIYFLLPKGSKSKLHKLKSDELWHFYLGDPLTLVQIHPDGKTEKVTLGRNIKSGQLLQHTVPFGCWFGAFPDPSSKYSLVGCTVSPGFDFTDFELAKRNELIKKFRGAENIIKKLT